MEETSLGNLEFNPLDPDFRRDPYPHYRRLRAQQPVYRSALGFWAITRHRDAVAVLRDRRFGAVNIIRWQGFDDGPQADRNPLHWVMRRFFLFSDPPQHTRLRNLVSKAFTARAVEALRPRIESIVDELLGRVAPARRMDVIADLAFPLPAMVICEMLGVPFADRDRFGKWTVALAAALDPAIGPQTLALGSEAAAEFIAYFRRLMAQRRSEPKEDLLSALLAAEQHGDRLSEDEVVATSILLLAAGHETTAGLIGNATLSLLRNPAELAKLRQQPELFGTALEECLRYESPAQFNGRTALEDVDVGGETIAKGELAMVAIGAVDRDPEVFTDPDRLDVARSRNPHLAFGLGTHFCLGAPLARLEGRVALEALVRRTGDLRLIGEEARWRPMISIRSLEALPVEF
jgi:pimeloyl-[acyl-carrier protein] synthase